MIVGRRAKTRLSLQGSTPVRIRQSAEEMIMFRAVIDLLPTALRHRSGFNEPVVIRRESKLFHGSRHWPNFCHQDLASHRQFHHLYEDLLS